MTDQVNDACMYTHPAECSSQFESFDIPLGMHTLLEEGQYVVPWLNFSCSGNITAWEFAAVQDGRMRGGRMRDKQVILQLWEPLPSSINPTSPSQFTLVTSVMLSTRVDGNERTSFSFDLPQPLPFQSGDALGFSILNTGLGIAAVTANGMAERVIYSSQTGGGGRGGGRGGNSKDDDEEEGRSEGSTCEVTCFDISTTVVSPLSAYSPAMTIKFNTGNSSQGIDRSIDLYDRSVINCCIIQMCLNIYSYLYAHASPVLFHSCAEGINCPCHPSDTCG